MIIEFKFVFNEVVEVLLLSGVRLKVWFVDCVGYFVDGVMGYLEENYLCMVIILWFEKLILFEEVVEIGIKKVI